METLADLETWRNQLSDEEELLTKLIKQIDQQINCLQVEQMELQSSMGNHDVKSPVEKNPQNDPEIDITAQKLDLTVPVITKNDAEEEEDEDF